MNDCLAADELTSLSSALGWNAEAKLRHIEQCPACQATLREVGAVREVLASSEAVSPDWLAGTQRMIDAEAAAAAAAGDRESIAGPNRSASSSRRGLRAAAALFALASMTTMVLLLPPDGGARATFSPGLAAALSVTIGAAVAAYYTWRNRLLGPLGGGRQAEG